jgi:DNA polymerase-3 subunit gamma/tau
LSSKLYEWTKNRWIISLSKKTGQPSKKEKDIILKKEFLDKAKKREVYQKVLKIFPDAELIDIDIIKEKNDD